MLAIDRAWAAQRFASEGAHPPEETFTRRWTLGLIEQALAGLEAEYAQAGKSDALTAMQPFLGYSGEAGAEGNYERLAARLGVTDGAARKAVYDLRTRYRELLRAAVADTVAREAQIDAELGTLLCELPPAAASIPPRSTLRRVNPEELLTRAMHSAKVSSAGALGWTPPRIEEVSDLFPNYEVVAELGHGGMGAVYQARQTELDRLVAIKLLPLEISVDRDFAERFKREARAMAKLNHPNIVSVHDFGTTREGHLFFVMEYVDGATLHQLIRGPGAPGKKSGDATAGLAPANALYYLEQVCEALAYAHGKGVIHRDIKPANVLVSREGRVKVADFGLARLTDAAEAQLGHTQTGSVMGTPDYMAPEQKRGMAVDHRADIYSLGVMLYEMLCREVPQGAFKMPSQRAGTDPRLDAVITRALAQEPAERFKTTTEMKTAIEAIRTTPAPAAGKKAASPASPTVKKPIALWLPIAAGVVVLAVIIGALISKKPSRTASDVPPGRVGVPPAGSGVPPEHSSAPANVTGSAPVPSKESARETRAAAGGTPTLPGSTPPAAVVTGQSSMPATPTAPREWLVSKTASVPPPADALEFQGSKYKLVQESLPWIEAKAKAEAMGGHLATITSRDEHDWLVAQLPKIPQGPNGVWVGGFAAEGTEDWRWSTGEPAQQIAWAAGQPNWRRDPVKAGGSRANFAAGLILILNPKDGANRMAVTPVTSGGVNSSVIIGYLVEWDRFSAADAAANDPAKWKSVISKYTKEGRAIPNAKVSPEGLAVDGVAVLTIPEERAADVTARVTFKVEEATRRVTVHVRSTRVPPSNPNLVRYYAGSVTHDYAMLMIQSYDRVSGKTLDNVELSSVPGSFFRDGETAIVEVRAVGDLLILFVNNELRLSIRDGTLKEGFVQATLQSRGVVTGFDMLRLDSTARVGIATVTAPPPTSPVPATPKPLSEMEKWLAQVDGPQQESYQREVMKPFETAVAELKKGYLAALDARIAAASSAGRLDDALGWRTERQRFADAGQTLPADDTDLPAATSKPVAAALPPLRAQFRTQLARLEADRTAKARAAFTRYDAILTPAITQLTQRQRLDDALLVKTKRDEVQNAWLQSSAVSPVSAGAAPASPARGTPVPKPAGKSVAATPTPAVKKYPKGDDRKAAEWVLSVGGEVSIETGGAQQNIREAAKLPKGRFDLVGVKLDFLNTPPLQPIDSLEPLAGLEAVRGVNIRKLLLTDEQIAPLASLRSLKTFTFQDGKLTDGATPTLAGMTSLTVLGLGGNRDFTGARLHELAALELTELSLEGTGVQDDALEALPAWKTLQLISLKYTKVTDNGMRLIARLPDLRRLLLGKSGVTIEGLRLLKPLRNLSDLGWNFESGKGTEQLAEIARLFSKLTNYELEYAIYTAADFASLSAFSHLNVIQTYGPQFDDATIERLSELKGLTSARFKGSPSLTDAGLATLARHKGLTEVVVREAKLITDAGLTKLAEMKQLKHLEVTGCPQLTPAGLDAFKKARPDVTLLR